MPTPIGNLRDITLRALDVLKACDYIVCEDSRVTGKLLVACDIRDKKKIVYNDHASDETQNYIVSLLAEDKIIALVSDAGTPMISDPGYKLVKACFQNEIYVTALPGANAILPALQLSDLPSNAFTFLGFLPGKDKAVREIISYNKNRKETIIFYESPQRIHKTIEILSEIIPERQVSICREISKIYEESIRLSAKEMHAHLAGRKLKGEIVLLINGQIDEPQSIQNYDADIRNRLNKGQSLKDIAEALSKNSTIKKKDFYNRAHELKENQKL